MRLHGLHGILRCFAEDPVFRDLRDKCVLCRCAVNERLQIFQDKTLEQIYDLFAVRIVVETVKDCYAALGVIHELYKPIPGRFKDYIAMPKPNMYQSLHTTLISSSGQPFEIQIRTFEMHRTAEYGIAAHWKYKESGSSKSATDSAEAKLSWLRQILEWQRDMSDNKEFLSLLKSDLDLFTDNVYCFTPTMYTVLHQPEMLRTFRAVLRLLILPIRSTAPSETRWWGQGLTGNWSILTM